MERRRSKGKSGRIIWHPEFGIFLSFADDRHRWVQPLVKVPFDFLLCFFSSRVYTNRDRGEGWV